ncbi:MAG: radical SAM protein [Deltaproteobacteria bacterium]|nr:radical SAM protein [Deltaproteobacteria bacterium]
MAHEGDIYRPPSEADAFILQATIGCSHNACTYCRMYRDKRYRVRETREVLCDVEAVAARHGEAVEKVFVADGDPLAMGFGAWEPLLEACRRAFPRLKRVSTYATAQNVLEKSPEELSRLRELGLARLYLGPESGDDETLRRVAKGAGFAEHEAAARRAHDAGLELSVIFLLGVGGRERSEAHARASARLLTAMDPRFASALTLTVLPGTPQARLEERGRFVLPGPAELLRELRVLVDEARPTAATFRTNHASNYLPLRGELPRDRERIVALIDAALEGSVPLRPEWSRGL